MTEVRFFDPEYQPDSPLIYSVIAATYMNSWIFVRHRNRSTWEIAGGHIEMGETSYEAACRELKEETGATRFNLACVATYSVNKDELTGYGRLFLAEVLELGEVPDVNEIAEIILLDHLPDNLTYPDIQPSLFSKSIEYLEKGGLARGC